MIHGPATVTETRWLLAAASLSSTVCAVVFTVTEDADPLGRAIAPTLFAIAAISSVWCLLRPARIPLIGSAAGLVAGYLERALAVPIAILDGTLPLDSSRAWLPPAVYGFVAALTGFVWARSLLPVIEHAAAGRRARRDE